MPDVSFIIPIAPYHDTIAGRAVESAQLQTVPSTVIYIRDKEGKGPAWARNEGLRKCDTPFVVFLDADDWVEPTFVERCLSVWQAGQYVYTDWKIGDTVHEAPSAPWCGDGQWHVITTLLPKAAVDRVGGFTTLPGAEDTEFYWALTRSMKCCGIHLPEPLFHYGKEGRRAKAFKDSDAHDPTMRQIIRSYGNMGCCGDNDPTPLAVIGGEPGDVPARAIWGGNKVVRGFATGRSYPRAGNGQIVMVHPADVAAAPQLWRLVEATPEPDPVDILEANYEASQEPEIVQSNGFQEMVAAVFGVNKPPPTLAELEAATPAAVTPDVEAVTTLAQGVYGE